MINDEINKKIEHFNVAIVMPVHNAEKVIEKTINFINKQSFSNWTLYIYDDCSTDGTVNVLEKLSNKFFKINYLKCTTDKPGGPGFARNVILDEIRNYEYSFYSYIAYCDVDDYWTHEDHLAISLLNLSNNDCDMVCSYPELLKDGKPGFSFGIPTLTEFNESILQTQQNYIFISTVVHKINCLSIGNFRIDVDGLEDWDYWIRISEAFIIKIINKPIKFVTYNISDGTQASNSNQKKINFILTRGRVQSKNIKPEVEKIIDEIKIMDPYIYDEVIGSNYYGITEMSIFNNSLVVDVGTHIGSFVALALRHHAKHIIAFEPNPVNFEKAYKLFRPVSKNIKFINKAVTSNDKSEIGITINDCCSMTSKDAEVKVNTINWDSIEKYYPNDTFNRKILKMDNEGAEYDILLNLTGKQISYFDDICIEIHEVPKEQTFSVVNLMNYLMYFGFQPIYVNQACEWDSTGTKILKAWERRIIYFKKKK